MKLDDIAKVINTSMNDYWMHTESWTETSDHDKTGCRTVAKAVLDAMDYTIEDYTPKTIHLDAGNYSPAQLRALADELDA